MVSLLCDQDAAYCILFIQKKQLRKYDYIVGKIINFAQEEICKFKDS